MKPHKEKQSQERSPVVVVMGHVDHGKTKLLDYIRNTNVVEKEAGGITQSIGAYEIVHKGKRITFVDTPGHEAFFKMRERGASVADLAILVVAADEGVKPQTKEAIKHILAAEIPFIVALTKIDKPAADVSRAKSMLSEAGVYVEGMGGTVPLQEVSAKEGTGMSDLLDLLLIAVELEEFRYDPDAPVHGVVVEAHKDPQRGVTTTVIVTNGTLRPGAEIATRTAKGKVRIMENFLGKALEFAIPSSPALVVGFETTPMVGEEFALGAELYQPPSEELPQTRSAKKGKKDGAEKEAPAAEAEADPRRVFSVVVRADVHGSSEAVVELVKRLSSDYVRVEVVDAGVGDITDGDINLAISTKALVAAFNVKVQKAAIQLAKNNVITIVSSPVIYQLVQLINKEIEKTIPKPPKGILKVLAVFRKIDHRQVIGGKVTAGEIKNATPVEVWREEKHVGSGKIVNLQSQKADKEAVGEGKEAGILFDGGVGIKEGDELRQF